MKNMRIVFDNEAAQPMHKKARLMDLRAVVVEDDENEHQASPSMSPQNELLSSPHDSRSIVSFDSNTEWEVAPASVLDEEIEEQTHQESPLTFSDLPDDILSCLGTFLNVGSLKTARLVSKRFCRVLSSDDAGWSAHCQRLWRQKANVSQDALRMYHNKSEPQTNNAMNAFRKSCEDARSRHEISPQELLFDPARGCHAVWDFRFKGAAGKEWTTYDPWCAGHKARRMVFLANGTVRQLVQEVVEDKTVSRLRLPFHDATDPVGVEITWKFVSQPMDLPAKARGAYIRLTINGRDVPTYVVHRSPTGNWGFLMENCWGVFASFTLPQRPLQPETSSQDSTPASNGSDLLQDDSLPVTSRLQWREALMYNLGASRLPHGPTAARDFDRAWRHASQRLQARGLSKVDV